MHHLLYCISALYRSLGWFSLPCRSLKRDGCRLRLLQYSSQHFPTMLSGSVAPLQPFLPVCSGASAGCLLLFLLAGPHQNRTFQKICISSPELKILVPVLCHYAHRQCLEARKALESCDPLSEHTFCTCCLNLFTPDCTSPVFSAIC